MALNLDNAQTVAEAIEIGLGGPGITKHSTDPEGIVTAPVGSIVLRTDNGAVYKKTTGSGNTGWQELGAPPASAWQEFLYSYTDFSTGALINTLNVVTLVGKTISQARIKHSTAFAGAGITDYNIRLGIAGELDRYLTDFDVMQAVSTSAKKRSILNLEEDVTVQITAESVGANLNAATAGNVSIQLLLTEVEIGSPMNSEFSFGAGIGDGLNPIVVGEVGSSVIPYNGTILGWYIIANTTGSIVVDIWKDSFANYPPTVGDTITGTEKPTLSSQNKNSDLTLTTWTTNVVAGDVVRFKVDSVDGVLNSVTVLVLCSRG
jgi:hypothetical protein